MIRTLYSSRRALTLALLLCTIWSAQASAQERAFAARHATTDNGDILITGNISLTCDPSQTTDCLDARLGQAMTARNNNNAHMMMMVDVDGDSATFNSSTARFELPAGGEVLWAGLYWGANVDNGTNGVAAPDAAARNVVRLKVPGRSTYETVTSSVCDSRADDYQCFHEVTSLMPTSPTGDYTVANVQTGTGNGQYAGWALVVVVRDPGSPTRNLVVFDGYQYISSTNATVDIPVSGFLTPPSGPVNTRVGLVGYEGDYNATGDSVRLDGSAISDGVNPTSNVFNSSNAALGAHNTTQQPAQRNQLGFDLDVIEANGVIPNNATSATITMRTSGETYFPGVITFATEIYAPRLDALKTVTDLNGGDIEPGDTLEYTITITNNGLDAADSVIFRDALPAGLTYVPGSITIDGAARTDAASDDQAEWVSAAREVVARVGTGATSATGGALAGGGAAVITFRAVLDGALRAGDQVPSQGALAYRAVTLGSALESVTDDDLNAPGRNPTVVTIDTSPPAVAITSPANLSATNAAAPTIAGTSEPGAQISVSVNGGAPVMTTADASGAWSVTAPAGLGEGQHVVVAEATDRAGNTGAATSAFSIDTTAPAISITQPADGSTVSNRRPSIEGQTEPSRPVTLSIDGGGDIALTADSSGRFTFDPVQDLSNGSHQLRARTTDVAGNPAETTITFTVDTTAPTLTITSPASGAHLSDARPSITGASEADAAITLSIDGGPDISVTANAQGQWTHAIASALPDGQHTVAARTTNARGITATTSITFTVDTTPPVIVITQPTAGQEVGTSRPPLRGTTEPRANLTAGTVNAMIGAAASLDSGDWVILPTVDLPRGPITVIVSATDRAGNSSSAEVSFIVAAGEASILTITSPADGAVLTAADDRKTITGTANPGAPVNVSVDGAEPVEVIANGQGQWVLQLDAPLADGAHTAEATTPGQTVRVAFSVDATAPGLTIDSPADNAAFDDAQITVRGQSDPGREVQVFVDGDRVGTATVGADGTWSVDLTAELAPGPHTITARTADEVGNTSEASITINIADEGRLLTGAAEDSCACRTTHTPAPVGLPIGLVIVFGLLAIRRPHPPTPSPQDAERGGPGSVG